MGGEGEVGDGSFGVLCVGDLLDEVGGVQSDDVGADDLVRVLVVEDFDDAVALVFGEGLGVGAEVRDGLAECEALVGGSLLGLFFVEADLGDFGMRKAGGGDGLVVDDVVPSADVLDGGDALGGGGMGEHLNAIGVADTVQVRDDVAVGTRLHAHGLVDLDDAPDEFDALVFEFEGLRIGDAARRDEARVHFEGLDGFLRLGVDRFDDHGPLASLPGRHLRREDARAVVDAPGRQEQALGQTGNFTVEGRHQVVHRLDERHLRAQRGVHVRELQADDPTSNDRRVLRDVLQVEGFVGGIDRFAVHLDPRRHEGNRPRRQHDILRRHRLAIPDVQGVGSGVGAQFRNDFHAQPLQRPLQAPSYLGHQLLGVRGDALAIVRDVAQADAHGFQMHLILHLPHAPRRRQEGLRRHAPTVHAGPPDVAAAQNASLQPHRPRVKRRPVTAHAAAHDRHVKVEVVHPHHGTTHQALRAHGQQQQRHHLLDPPHRG
mmetsp:Transcript_8554/g.28028  ORF Transcript_8554/g.28028 Transcript_8554/m.28028 type:complete len:488 (+) Transcript_8554:375-1838(+)